MKAKKGMILGIMAVCFMLLVVANVDAELKYYECTVVFAGPESGVIYICLSDVEPSPAFTNLWLKAPAAQAKEMLAVALTAMSNGSTVVVHVDVDNRVLDGIFLPG